jgi:hypothetical protein
LNRTRQLLSAIGVVVVSACGSDFAPKNVVSGVRILAARADLPYARPGEAVKLSALAHDGRKQPGEPMRVQWIPAPCIDPPGGQYYGCYSFFDAAFPIGVDLSPWLSEGRETSLTIPPDALAKARARPGGEPTATAYVFVIACAGHVERITRRGGPTSNELPLACFAQDGRRLPDEDFILGFTRVFVFPTRRNAIPTLDGMTFEGNPVDPTQGVVTKPCVPAPRKPCETVSLDVRFQDAAAEADPDNIGPDGATGRETLYVDWFTTLGKFGDNRRTVFDSYRGRPEKTEIELEVPTEAGNGTIWAVLHDNRGGTSWLEVPLVVR